MLSNANNYYFCYNNNNHHHNHHITCNNHFPYPRHATCPAGGELCISLCLYFCLLLGDDSYARANRGCKVTREVGTILVYFFVFNLYNSSDRCFFTNAFLCFYVIAPWGAVCAATGGDGGPVRRQSDGAAVHVGRVASRHGGVDAQQLVLVFGELRISHLVKFMHTTMISNRLIYIHIYSYYYYILHIWLYYTY